MEKHHKFSIWYVLIALWVVIIMHDVIVTSLGVQNIPYSTFMTALEEGRVTEVAVTADRIQGKIKTVKDGKEVEEAFTTVRVDKDLSDLLEKHNVMFKGIVESNFIKNVASWVIPVLLFVGIWYFMMRRLAAQQGSFLTLGKNKAKVYMEDEVNVTFRDVAGVDEAKQELVEVTEFLRSPDRFTRLGGKLPKGVLLVGPPGTGKTLLARAVAGESKVPFFSMSGSEFVELFVGMGAARVRDLFSQAKTKAPCIIFIDELDALGKARGLGLAGGHDEREQTLNQLLVEMDGFDPTIGVILMAATNRPEILDPALLRPGRFDRHVLVDRPDKVGREEILKVHLRTIKTESNIDVSAIAAMTPGFVGADLANLVNEAALLAVRRNKELVGMAEFQEAVERIVAGLEKKNRLINKKEREIVAYHEVGHALVALGLPGTDPVRKISIIPRGVAALGYTMQVPTEDRFLMTRQELKNKISVLLGGRASEEIHFGDISTGAHNDLSKATDIARSMIKEYGMSQQLGQIYFERERKAMFLEPIPPSAPDYSEETARIIDQEVKNIIDTQYEVAKNILRSHQGVLKEGAEILLKEENIEGERLKALLDADSGSAARDRQF
ncbi:MAG TPA: ATP-dependent zinc metalloprotease FtsH [Thermodesulfobacteriota bacterium]|nr:ATP-dependent zinc metalloprotease FtsH [Deltaproteobacteria bacterium]HNR12712.1 ATP-dependent zinc metalloprotease FtsH [Thermodesulfobacteriota bacterium]HNU71714.1 ATP-dependent zinc metalloprotease FtsH [Thermodesulfobacteriota bacterium]